MTRRLALFLVALVGALGYALGSRTASRTPAEPALGTMSATNATIDWAMVSDLDLTAAVVFRAARDEGLSEALDTLVALAARDVSVDLKGHSLAHALARYAIARSGNAPVVLSECRPLFKAGCQHGVLEGYMSALPSVDPAAVTALCTALEGPGTPAIDVRECAHGLGHGFADRLAYDLPDALSACDVFSRDVLREECHDGVFMQNAVRGDGLPARTPGVATVQGEHDHGGAPAPPSRGRGGLGTFRADDLAFPCNQVEVAYQPSCWSYQPLAVARLVGDGAESTLRACDLAAPESRPRCYAGYGKQAFAWFGRDEAQIVELCSTLREMYVDVCLSGVVEWYVDADWGADGALAFCDRVHKGGRNAVGCFESLGERVSFLHADRADVERECRRPELAHHVEACLRGAARG